MKTTRILLLGIALGVTLAAITQIAPAIAYPVIESSTVTDAAGYPEWGADARLSVTTTTATSGNLTSGFYILQPTADMFCDQGATGVTATTSERFLKSGGIYPVRVRSSSNYIIACIVASGTGTLYIAKDSYL